MTEAGNPPKPKPGGFPASLESAIPPRFPHSHRPGGCYIGFKIQGPKAKPERSLSSAPVPFPFRLILQLEKTEPFGSSGPNSALLTCTQITILMVERARVELAPTRERDE